MSNVRTEIHLLRSVTYGFDRPILMKIINYLTTSIGGGGRFVHNWPQQLGQEMREVLVELYLRRLRKWDSWWNDFHRTRSCWTTLQHSLPNFTKIVASDSRSQWSRGLRRRSAAARLLRSWVRIPPGAWILVCCECCVLSGRGLCDELITRPEESYRLWCVVVCDLEDLRNEEVMTRVGSQRHSKKN